MFKIFLFVCKSLYCHQMPLSFKACIRESISEYSNAFTHTNNNFILFVTYIHEVLAEDLDEGGNGEVRYSTKSDMFLVDAYSGWVTTLTPLDREANPRHTILLTAVDSGHPPLSSSALLEVEIVDYNDSPPTFSETKYFVTSEYTLSCVSFR